MGCVCTELGGGLTRMTPGSPAPLLVRVAGEHGGLTECRSSLAGAAHEPRELSVCEAQVAAAAAGCDASIKRSATPRDAGEVC